MKSLRKPEMPPELPRTRFGFQEKWQVFLMVSEVEIIVLPLISSTMLGWA